MLTDRSEMNVGHWQRHFASEGSMQGVVNRASHLSFWSLSPSWRLWPLVGRLIGRACIPVRRCAGCKILLRLHGAELQACREVGRHRKCFALGAYGAYDCSHMLGMIPSHSCLPAAWLVALVEQRVRSTRHDSIMVPIPARPLATALLIACTRLQPVCIRLCSP
jgi:hypothetical protein